MSTRIVWLCLLVLLFSSTSTANEKSRTELQIAAQNASEVFAKSTGEAKKKAQENAIRAHILWGDSESAANDRDRAVAAYASGISVAPAPVSFQATDSLSALAREAQQKLNRTLREGLPLFATDDVLQIVATRAQANLWQPKRVIWQLPDVSLEASSTQKTREFLWTSGKLFVPPTTDKYGSAQLWRTPPMYAHVTPQTLPRALKLDRVLYGYTRENDGANKGLWRQTVRVFYASTYQTQNGRDDAPRAEILCQQFLRIAAMFEDIAGVKNRYASDSVTSVYLPEIASEWPNEAPDKNWNAGAWLDSSPGDLTLFRIGTRRGEAEWLRQLAHEYSHVVMPPFGPFPQPLETWGNGSFGETLALLWAANDAQSFVPQSDDASAKLSAFENSLLRHVSQNALPSLQLFALQGPQSKLRSQWIPQSLEYSQGFGVFIERAYGSQILTSTLQSLSHRRVTSGQKPKLTAESLLSGFVTAVNNAGNSERCLPIYFGAILQTEKLAPENKEGISSDAMKLSKRTPLELGAKQRMSGWIYIPPVTKILRIEGEGLEKLQIEGWKPDSSSTQNERVFDISTRRGWQNITVSATANVTIRAAWLEK